MHYNTAIVFLSFLLQAVAVYHSFRLIAITGHTRAWVLLSIGIATMAARQLITCITLLSAPAPLRGVDFTYEVIGVIGSAMMLSGVILIKPMFLAVRNAEAEQRSLAKNLQEALSNIKVLKEMLPICANCKKIRDDDGFWQNVESYISKHSDTKFSHGICPDCVRRLYPEFSDRILDPGHTHQ